MCVRADSPSIAYRSTALGLIALAVLGHTAWLRQSTSPDLEMFVYMGKLAASGGRVGVDLIDNKFPTVGLLMSVPYRIFGAHWIGYGLLSLAATCGAAFLLAAAGRGHFGRAAYWPTLVAAMVWGNFFLCIASAFQLEHLQLFLCSLAGIAALHALRDDDWRDALVVGLCTGLAAWLKPNALSAFGAFGIAVLLRTDRARWKLLVAASCGALTPTVVAAVCLHLSGTLTLLPQIAGQISRYSAHSAWNVSEVFSKLFDIALLFTLPFLAICLLPRPVRGQRAGARVFAIVLSKSATIKHQFPDYGARELSFLFIWLGLEFLGGFLQGRMLPYYFLPMAAPAALLFGRMSRTPRSLPLLAGFAAPLAIACVGVVIFWNHAGGVDDKQRIVAWLMSNHRAGESVWVDDYPRLAVESDWRPASRLPLINLMTNDDEAPTYFGDLLLGDLERNRPKFLVLRSDQTQLIRYFTRTQADTDASPIRRTRMTATLRSLYHYATINYRPAAEVGPYTVWSRRDEVSPTWVTVAGEAR